MSDHTLAQDIRHILQRDSSTRQAGGRMNFASAHSAEAAYAMFEGIMQRTGDIILTTGCGLPDKVGNLPVRFPALIVPGLQLLSNIKEVCGDQRRVTYQVYQAGDFIKTVNKVSARKIDESAAFMLSYLERFTREYFPAVAEQVTFDFQKNVSPKQLEPVVDFLQTIKGGQAGEHLESITGYSGRDKDRGCPYTYAAANIYFNGLCDVKVHENATIIPVGGQKEIPFFHLTSLYHENCGNGNTALLPVSYNAQGIPSYFPCKQGDITVKDLAGGNSEDILARFSALPHAAQQDFQGILEPVGATLPRLLDMANAVRQQTTCVPV